MANLAEIKANSIYFLARRAETFIPPIQLTSQQPPEEEGSFARNAWESFVNYTRSEEPTDKAESLTELSQQLINLGRFRQARHYLDTLRELNPFFNLNDRRYYNARKQEKLAWIADYETGFTQELRLLSASQELVKAIPKAQSGQREEDLLSTITHFSGRAHLGLACQGIDPEYNLDQAKRYFWSDLSRFQELRSKGDPKPANEGFQHGWLALCDITAGELGAAHLEIEEAGKLFREYVEQPENSASGIEAHYCLLRGLLHLKRQEYEAAAQFFQMSIDIRNAKNEPYPMGEASARMGIARAALGRRDLPAFASGLKKAVKAHPLALLSALNGRPTG